MSVKKSSRNLLDPQTLILKKYFSFVGKRNHSIDIFHDKANIFPEFSAFEKPCCKVAHHLQEECDIPDEEAVKEITKGYLLPPIKGNNSELTIAKQTLVPTLKELRAREKLQQEAKMRDNEEKKRIKESQERERKIRRGYIEERRVFNKDDTVLKSKNATILAGKSMIEKSNRLLQELKSPLEIISQINNQEKREPDRKKDKEEMKKLVKRLDITLKAEEPGKLAYSIIMFII